MQQLKSRSVPSPPSPTSVIHNGAAGKNVDDDNEDDNTSKRKIHGSKQRKYRILLVILSLCLVAIFPALLSHVERPEQLLQKRQDNTDVLDVLIIGAGWAGIAAANTLLRHPQHHKFEILEARDYIGGRSRTVYPFVHDLPVEVGSAWTYEDTQVHELLLQQHLPYGKLDDTDLTANGWYSQATGGEIKGKTQKQYQKMWEEYTEYSHTFGKRLKKSKRDKPYSHILDSFLLERPDIQKSQQAKSFLQTMVHAQLEMEYAAPLEQISGRKFAKKVHSDSIFGDAEYFIPVQGGGFDKIMKPVVRPIQRYIQLNTTVTKIDYTNRRMTKVTFNDQEGKLHTKMAKTVLVTVPLGVLKKQTIQFVPSLPQSKQEAIDFMGFGILNKCVFYWDHDQSSWWPQGKQVLTYVSNTTVGAFSMFFNDMELGNGGHFVLSAWTGGTPAVAMEQLSDDETVAQVLSNLQTMLGTHVVPAPSKFFITRWGQDPFAYGSYSYYRVGQDDEDRMENAREELGRRTGSNIFWAGEAISYAWRGTTVGAYMTGEIAAKSIIEKLRKSSSKKRATI